MSRSAECSSIQDHLGLRKGVARDYQEKFRAQSVLRQEVYVAVPGTPTTAVVAARISQPQYIMSVDVSPETEDALDSCQARVGAAKKEADKSKSAMGMRQSVRQDMRLRAKVCALAHQGHKIAHRTARSYKLPAGMQEQVRISRQHAHTLS